MACTALLSCNSKQPAQTTVIGTLEGKSEATLYVSYTDDKGYKNDEVEVKEGMFEWSKPIACPMNVTFSLTNSRQGQRSEVASIWTEPGILKLTLNADNLSVYTLRGSKINALVKTYEQESRENGEKMRELSQQMQSADTPEDEKGALREQYRVLNEQMNERNLKFVEQHPDSYYSAYLLFNASQRMEPERITHYLDLLKGAAVSSPYAQRMRLAIEGEINGRVGSKAPLFSRTDINEQPFDLITLIGQKYVIVDFWASWCAPCRQGNPHLKDLFHKYRDNGLVVVCVADNDGTPDEWRKAVAQDGLEEFVHVLRGWGGIENFFDLSNDLDAKYGVHSLPTKFLIDKNGVIVGRYGGGGERHDVMDTKLMELFGY